MLNLTYLLQKNPIAFQELLQKSKNSTHVMVSNTQDDVLKLGLMHKGGEIHPAVKDILLSAVMKDDFKMTWDNPLIQSHFQMSEFADHYKELIAISFIFFVTRVICSAIYHKINQNKSIDQAMLAFEDTLSRLWKNMFDYIEHAERDSTYGNYHRLC